VSTIPHFALHSHVAEKGQEFQVDFESQQF